MSSQDTSSPSQGPKVDFEPMGTSPTPPTSASTHEDPALAAMQREHEANPGRGDSPPEDPSVDGPSFDADTDERDERDEAFDARGRSGGVVGAVKGFFAPADPNRARGRKGKLGEKSTRTKPVKPKSPAQVRRENDKKKRAMRLGVRYGGDRAKWFMLQAGVLVLALLSVIALVVALGKPSRQEIATQVQEGLTASGRDFPAGDSVMWAGQVLRIWGTWNEASPEAREVALSPYLSSGMPIDAGWNGRGTQEVTYASINPEPIVHSENHATIEATYQVQDGTWRCVAMPLFAYQPETFGEGAPWAFSMAGNPTPIPCGARTGVPSMGTEDNPLTAEGRSANTDIGQTMATDFFPGFFGAWGSSDQSSLTQYTASGFQTTGLGGAMSSVPPPTIGEVSVYLDDDGPLDGTVYQAFVPVTWTASGSTAQVEANYVVPVLRSGERWYVAGEPQAAISSPEAESRAPGSVPQPGQGVEMPTYPGSPTTPSPAPAVSNPNITPAEEEPAEDSVEQTEAPPEDE